MNPNIAYQLMNARIADMHRQAQRDGIARAADPQPPHASTSPRPVSCSAALSPSWPGCSRWPAARSPTR